MKKRILAFFVMVVMCLTTIGVVTPGTVAKASTGDIEYLLTQGVVLTEENLTATYYFTNDTLREVAFLVMADYSQDVVITLTNTETGEVSTLSMPGLYWEYSAESNYYGTIASTILPVGVYQLDLQGTEAASLILGVAVQNKTMEISVSEFTITAGQKKTLEVTDAPEAVTWSSNKPAVASVSSKGVVTAKKAGKAVITATSGDQKVKCTVTVKKNQYTGRNITLSDAGYDVIANVTKVSYKGKELSVTVKVVNGTMKKVTKISKLSIKITTDSGSKIASYTFKNLKGMSSYSSRTYKLTIPKKYVKKKSADLRNAICNGDFKYTYTY